MTDGTENTLNPEDLFRTEPAAKFRGHLFRGDDVRSAGGTHERYSERPVPTLCSRRTDKGPFHEIDPTEIRARSDRGDEERDLCGRCLDMAARRLDVFDGDATEAPFDPSEHTVEGLDDALDEVTDDDALRALRAAEAVGKNRVTALDAIERRIGGDDA